MKKVFLLLMFALCTLLSATAQTWGTNLLTNPVPANGSLTGWTITTDGGDGWAAWDGAFKSSYETCVLEQKVVLANKGFTSADLTGAYVTVAAQFLIPWAGGGQQGECAIKVYFYNASDALLQTVVLIDSTFSNKEFPWQQRRQTLALPANTASVKMEFKGRDQKNWVGQYGPRFTNGQIILTQGAPVAHAIVVNAPEIGATANKTSAVLGEPVDFSYTNSATHRFKNWVHNGIVNPMNSASVFMPDTVLTVTAECYTAKPITVVNTAYVTITTNPTAAFAGDTVTLSVAFAGGCDGSYSISPEVTFVGKDSFLMPDANVVITATEPVDYYKFAAPADTVGYTYEIRRSDNYQVLALTDSVEEGTSVYFVYTSKQGFSISVPGSTTVVLDSTTTSNFVYTIPMPEVTTLTCDYTYKYVASTGGNAGEGASNLFDGSTGSKWCYAFSSGMYVQFELDKPMKVMGYSITTANDNASNKGRNPKNWLLLASKDKTVWDTLHVVTNDSVLQDVNYTKYVLGMPQAAAKSYRFFKFVILERQGAATIQMSEFRLIPTCQYDSVLTHVAAKDATCTATGNAEYWSNAATGMVFKNAQGTEAFYNIKSVTIPTLPITVVLPSDTTDYSVTLRSYTQNKNLRTGDVVTLGESLYLTYKAKNDSNKVNRSSKGFYLSASDIQNCMYTVPSTTVSKRVFYVLAAPTDTVGYTWTANNSYSYGALHVGDTIEDGSTMYIYYTALPGYELKKTSATISVSASTTENGVFTIPVPVVYYPSLSDITASPLDSTSMKITWTDTLGCSAYYVLVSPQAVSDLTYAKGVKQTSTNSYTATGLVMGQFYYVYVKGVIGAHETMWADTIIYATTEEIPAYACDIHFRMHDSYGDGWNGAYIAVLVNGVEEDYITFEYSSDAHEKEYTASISGIVSLVWHKGNYDDEASLDIDLPSGQTLSYKNMIGVANGEVLYSGIPCNHLRRPDSLSYAYNAALDSVSFVWSSVDTASYEIVFVNGLEFNADSITPIALTDTTYAIAAVLGKTITMGVRAVLDGEYSAWKTIVVEPQPLAIMGGAATINNIIAMARDIQLNYYEEDVIMGNGIYVSDSAKTSALYVDVLRLVVEDTTSVYYYRSLSEYCQVVYMAFDTAGQMSAAYTDSLENKSYINLPAGSYYFLFAAQSVSDTYSIVLVDLNKKNPESTELEFYKYYTDTLGGTVYAVANTGIIGYQDVYTFSLSDSTDFFYSLDYDGSVSAFVYTANDSLIASGSSWGSTLPAGDYKIVIAGRKDDMYEFIAGPVSQRVNNFVSIPADTVFHYSPSDWTSTISYEGMEIPGCAYKFTVSDTTMMMFTATCVLTNGTEELYMSVYRDSLLTDGVCSEWFEDGFDYNYFEVNTAKDTTFYMIVLPYPIAQPVEATFAIHTQTDWSNPALYDTLKLAEPKQIEFNLDVPTYDFYLQYDPAPTVASMVYLEKGKYYRFVLQVDNPIYNVEYEPFIKIGEPDTLYEYVSSSDKHYSNDTVANYITYIDSTGFYPVYASVDYYSYNYEPSVSATLRVFEVVPVDSVYAQAELVTAPYETSGSISDIKQTRFSSYDYESYVVFSKKVMLYAGDTLYAEARASEDLSLIIGAEDGYGTYAGADDSPLAKDGEKVSFVIPSAFDSLCVQVLFYIDNPYCFDGWYEFRIAKHAADMEAVVVYPAVDKEVVEVIGLDSKASDVREELAKLIISAVDANDNEVAVLDNDPSVWEIDMAAGIATYELNNGDLPLGYEFTSFTELIQVSFVLTTGLDNIAAEDTTDAPRATKFFHNGQIYIRTVDGAIYTVTGLRVK